MAFVRAFYHSDEKVTKAADSHQEETHSSLESDKVLQAVGTRHSGVLVQSAYVVSSEPRLG